jgi:hypothetical protein
MFRCGIVFGTLSIGNFLNVARILYQSILDAASCTDKRPTSFTRELDTTQHAVKALVRTSGRRDQSVPEAQSVFRRRIGQRHSWNPAQLDTSVQVRGGIINGSVGRKMRVVRGLEVSNNTDPSRSVHILRVFTQIIGFNCLTSTVRSVQDSLVVI